jgi:acyl-CoA reductase-like NAD-dependent aldehyde dehydrogenase
MANKRSNNGQTATLKRRRTSKSVDIEPRTSDRLGVLKTYKVYVGGKFPRTESGRYDKITSPTGEMLANVCRCSRKDFRDAVVVARPAQEKWAKASAYLRGQILYRAAEMLEGRRSQFATELIRQGADPGRAEAEVLAAIDTLVYYAGWCDKYQQVFSSVNPVASSHFNFSVVEPVGVVAVVAPEAQSLAGLVGVIAPVIAGGNSVIALASQAKPLSPVTLGEVLHASDLPGGVVNILTGHRDELIEHFASHMDVNAVIYCGDDPAHRKSIQTLAAGNVKRVVTHDRTDWLSDDARNPYMILDTQEVKTTWHPVGL